ncbi:MAG: hypothetical protein IKD04_07710 [Clostridia bacterium]|nr:hypothetical protein [Clostridia bacterium]
MQSIGLALILGLVYIFKSVYGNIKFAIMKKRFQIITGTIVEKMSFNSKQKQFKIEFLHNGIVKYIMVDKLDISIGDEFKFFYNENTGESFPYEPLNSSRKKDLVFALISLSIAMLLALLSALIISLTKNENMILEVIGFCVGVGYIVFGVRFLFKKEKNNINNTENERITAEEEINNKDFDEANIPEGVWLCMGCGRYNSDGTKRCMCGYKKRD